MVVQTRKNAVNKKIIFKDETETETSDTEYTPSTENSSSSEDSECGEEESTAETVEEEESDVDDVMGENDEKIYHIVNTLLKDKYKIYSSEKFTEFLNRVGELDPDVSHILTLPAVKDKYKIRLCELYSILLSQDVFSLEWIEVRNLLKNEIKTIQRKMCMFKDVDQSQLAIKLSEFKAVKEKSNHSFKEQIILLDTSVENKRAIYKKYKELSEFTNGEDYAKIFVWLQYATSIPYNQHIKINYKSNEIYKFLMTVYEKLNQEFHGMKKVKEQILLYLNIKLTNPNAKGFNLALLGEKGVGKCFAIDTRVLMADGHSKAVQHVKVGDALIGPNNVVTRVEQLVRGYDAMYTVHPLYSEPYTVCKGHLLTLRCEKNIFPMFKLLYSLGSYVVGDGKTYNIPVEIFYSFPVYLQNKFDSITSMVDFKLSEKLALNIPPYSSSSSCSSHDSVSAGALCIPPYLLGMWYGNNKPGSTEFRVNYNVNYYKLFKMYSATFKTFVNVVYDDITMIINLESNHTNSFKNMLARYNTYSKFKIPYEYICASVDEKFKFIAGIVDACGYVDCVNNEITFSIDGGDDAFFKDLILIIRSLGLYAAKLEGGYIRIFGPSAALESIPSIVYFKKFNKDKYNHNKLSVTKLDEADFFYGFQLAGESHHLFLLDDCTVVHNCFAKHTMLRMFDGTTKAVQHIVDGDEVMGDDNAKRVVQEVTSGQEMMYDVVQSNGKRYTVNESHILSLCLPKVVKLDETRYRVFSVSDGDKISYNDVTYSKLYDQVYNIDVDVLTYLQYGNDIRKYMRGYKKPFHTTDVSYSDNNLITFGLITVLNLLEKSWVKMPDIPIKLDSNYFKFDFTVDGGFDIYRYFRPIDMDIDVHSLVSTTQKKQRMLLAGVVLGYLNDDKHSETRIHKKFNILFHVLNIDKTLAQRDLCVFLRKLVKNDIGEYQSFSDVQVVPTSVGEYYGFTLESSSPNRRFLLDDGTVVHNTHISRTLANILNFPFEQISMGNVNNPEILTGHHSTYIGSKPGIIVDSLIKMKYNNGIIFLDEFDKITNQAVSNSMLHIVDPTQNSNFVDNYMGQDIQIDLSNIWFIFAMNTVPECGPLKDRLFIIELEGYSIKDKIEITKNFLLKRICKNAGITESDITISHDVCNYFINKISTGEDVSNPGVRYIEHALTDVVNKIVFSVNTSSQFEDMSFSISTLLKYPVDITLDLIDKFASDKTSKTLNLMYT